MEPVPFCGEKSTNPYSFQQKSHRFLGGFQLPLHPGQQTSTQSLKSHFTQIFLERRFQRELDHPWGAEPKYARAQPHPQGAGLRLSRAVWGTRSYRPQRIESRAKGRAHSVKVRQVEEVICGHAWPDFEAVFDLVSPAYPKIKRFQPCLSYRTRHHRVEWLLHRTQLLELIEGEQIVRN